MNLIDTRQAFAGAITANVSKGDLTWDQVKEVAKTVVPDFEIPFIAKLSTAQIDELCTILAIDLFR